MHTRTIGKLKEGVDHWNYGIQYGENILREKEFYIVLFFFKFKTNDNELERGFSFEFRFRI